MKTRQLVYRNLSHRTMVREASLTGQYVASILTIPNFDDGCQARPTVSYRTSPLMMLCRNMTSSQRSFPTFPASLNLLSPCRQFEYISELAWQ